MFFCFFICFISYNIMRFFIVLLSIVPIIYEVKRVRDGNNFATRTVEAKQHGSVIFTIVASFQVLFI